MVFVDKKFHYVKAITEFFYLKKIFSVCVCVRERGGRERERERERERSSEKEKRRGAGRERERIPSMLCTVSTEPDT